MKGGTTMLSSHLSFIESLHGETRQTFYDQHTSIAHVMHAGLFLLPLAGLLIRGTVGAVLGLTLFILCYYLLPYAWLATHGSRHH
jgi:hypothetical protein